MRTQIFRLHDLSDIVAQTNKIVSKVSLYGTQYSPSEVISEATEEHAKKRVKKKFISHNYLQLFVMI